MINYFYVTGTSRGIGLALTQELLEGPDARVIGIGRTSGPTDRGYEHVSLDLTDVDAVSSFRFAEHPDAEHIVLVNNAGLLAPRFLGSEDAESVIRTYAVNVVAPVILMNSFIATYRGRSCHRTICNLTSAAATKAVPGASLYGGTKAALEMTTRVAALELEGTGEGIRVFSVDPGSVDTDMQATLRNASEADFPGAARNRRAKADGLLSDPRVIAQKLAHLLCNPHSVTGDFVRLADAVMNQASSSS